MSTPEEAARRILNIDDGVSDEDHHEYLDAVAVARAYLELVQRERERKGGDVSLPLSEGKPETLSDRLRRKLAAKE